MARTGLGSWKMVLAKGSSSHPGWIMYKMTWWDHNYSSSQPRWMSSSHWSFTVHCVSFIWKICHKAWLNTDKQRVHQDELFTRIQPSLSDRFFISCKHNVLFCISYTFLVFPRKKRQKKTRKGDKENCVAIHRKIGNHIITYEIFLSLRKNYLTAKQ